MHAHYSRTRRAERRFSSGRLSREAKRISGKSRRSPCGGQSPKSGEGALWRGENREREALGKYAVYNFCLQPVRRCELTGRAFTLVVMPAICCMLPGIREHAAKRHIRYMVVEEGQGNRNWQIQRQKQRGRDISQRSKHAEVVSPENATAGADEQLLPKV